LKISTEEAFSIKGNFRKPFRKPFPPNKPNPTTEGLNFEGLQYALQTMLDENDSAISVPQENQNERGKKKHLRRTNHIPQSSEIFPTIFSKLILKLSIKISTHITLKVRCKIHPHPRQIRI
jgi:hypothetical protein